MSANSPNSARRAPCELDEQIVGMIRRSRRPLSAYDIIDLFADQQVKVVPTQIYRCLGRLIEGGVVRRIASLRAFCMRENDQEAVVFCRVCGAHIRLRDDRVFGSINTAARHEGFVDLETAIEVSGHCRNCRDPNSGIL